MKNKILVLCNHEIVLYRFKRELIEAFVHQGYQVVISMPKGESSHYFQDVLGCEFIDTPIDRRGINPITDVKLLRTYQHLIQSRKPDLIFALTIKPTIYGGMMARKHHCPFITNITGIGTAFQKNGLLKNVIVFLYRIALKRCSAAFFENEENQTVFLDHEIIEKEKSIVVQGAGVNLEEFPYTPMKRKDKLICSFVGRIMKEKGIEEFFYCVEQLKNENIEFHAYGFCEDDYLERLAELQKNANFIYQGFSDHMKEVYQASDCIILPSYHEGMSNVLLEAAAMGRVLITSDISGCKEAVVPNQSGFIVEKQNREALLQGLRSFLNLTFEERVQYGKNGRAHMEQMFDRREINAAYMKQIVEVMK